MKLKLRSIGTSTGVILPKQFLDRLKLKKDDAFWEFVTSLPKG